MKETKILIKENVELANNHIQNVEINLLQPLTKIAAAIKAININPTKDLIVDVLTNDAQKVEEIARENNPVDSGDSRLDKMIEEQTSRDLESVSKLGARYKCNTIYNGVKISNPAIARLFNVDSDGNPYLLESFIETMKEECREYVKTKTGAKLHKLQADLVNAMQAFVDAIKEIEDPPEIEPSWQTQCAMRVSFPYGIVERKETDNGTKFFAIPINFDPEEIEDDSFDLDSDDDNI